MSTREAHRNMRFSIKLKFKKTSMKKATVILLSFVYVLITVGAVAQSKGTNHTATNFNDGETTMESLESERAEKIHQDEVLSNPEMSGAARAETVGAGGNTAIIIQNGYRNSSSIVQKGDDNIAKQTQTGKDNDLRVEQTGKRNRSFESQTGDHNRKVKIQNDTETVIEQVAP